MRRALIALATAVLVGGLGAARAALPAPRQRATPPPVALVTDETQNRLLVVDLTGGRVLRRITLAADPEYVATDGGGAEAVVTSPAAAAVTLLDPRSGRLIKVLRGFASPHIDAISPDGQYAYVTDDARGQLDVIRLRDAKLVGAQFVGAGAHHLGFSPDEHQVWIALGQAASTIVILNICTGRPPPHVTGVTCFADPAHPRVVARLNPGFLAHDLLFAPDGRTVWITSANTDYVGVFGGASHRLLFRVPAGAPPQHLAFADHRVYITSGYGSTIEMVDPATGHVLKTAAAPYGSFDLDAADGFVAAASLLRGTLAVYDDQLRPLHVLQLAPATEDVAISP